MTQPVLIIHGGAASRRPVGDRLVATRASIHSILEQVYPRLKKGISAVAAVKMACALLEDDPLFNAGKGSKIQSDGKIRMSASLMDGHRQRFSGCVNVQRIKNPIYLAGKLATSEDRVLAEKGAETRARELGLEFANPFTKSAQAEYAKKREGKTGTVGAVAVDQRGHLAAATSTGGRGFEYPHRVSDTPTVAANFANRHCAVSATGVGEQIVEQGLAAQICGLVEYGIPLSEAVKIMMKKGRDRRDEFGFIAVDRKGQFFAVTQTPFMYWGAINASATQTSMDF
jgi:L-asparaginase